MNVQPVDSAYKPSLPERLINETPRLLFSVGLRFVKFVVLPLESAGIFFLHLAERILQNASLLVLKEHVGALAHDLTELRNITQMYGVPFEKENLSKVTAGRVVAKFIRILPSWQRANSLPILYAPGYLDNPETCRDTCRRLANRTGCPVYIPKYRRLFQSIEEHAKDVSSVKERMLQETDKTGFIFAGHSMGGLATGLSLARDKGACKLWITIATPHLGTMLAIIAPGACGREMKPNSAIIRELHGSSFLKKIPKLCIYTLHDQLVRPHSAKALTKRAHAQNYRCKKPCGHLAVRSQPDVEEKMALRVAIALGTRSRQESNSAVTPVALKSLTPLV